jgi:hypothetical protein
MRGGQQGRGRRPPQRAGHGAVPIDRQRQAAQAVRPGGPPVGLGPVLLDGDGRAAARPEHLADQGQPVRETGADDDAVGGGADAARPGQVRRQRRPQRRQAARVRVPQEVAGGGVERGAGRRQPRPARERPQVRHPGPEVVTGHGALRAGRRRHLPRARAVRRDPGSRSGARRQPALRHELAVGLGHAVAGDAEVGRERPGRRQPGAGVEPPVPHRVAQRGFQPGPHPRCGQVQVEIEARIGPSFLH